MIPSVPDDVSWLVTECLPDMDHVDALLYLARSSAPQAVGAILAATTINRSNVDAVLKTLTLKGLVAREQVGGEAHFSYRPTDNKARHAVESLRRMYETRPISLIRFIYERPPGVATQFADAFRLRKRPK